MVQPQSDIVLQPLPSSDPAIDTSLILQIWDHVSCTSVEVLLANRAGLFDFVANDCLYFALIQRLEQQEAATIGLCSSEAPFSGSEVSWRTAPLADLGPLSPDSAPPPMSMHNIGMIFLTASALPSSVNLGLALLPSERGHGYGSQAVHLVLKWAFEEVQFHRVQARVACNDLDQMDASIAMFTSLGFAHEGVTRRAVLGPGRANDGNAEWCDIANMAILDTEWSLRSRWREISVRAMKNRWDEMFARHDQERQEMIATEERDERRRHLKRLAKADEHKLAPGTDERKEAPGEAEDGFSPWETPAASAVKDHGDWASMQSTSRSGPTCSAHRDDNETSSEFSDLAWESLSENAHRSPASSVMHGPEMHTDWEAESVPRSASVLSTTSWDSAATAETWDTWETSSMHST